MRNNLKISFLIISHGSPNQLSRLVEKLTVSGDICFIHIDRKTNSEPFRDCLRRFIGKIRILEKRHDVWWCGWGTIAAALTMMEAAIAEGGFDRMVLLSESCYPCRPLEELKQRLSGNKEFISIRQMGEHESFMERYTNYHLIDTEYLNPRGRTEALLQHATQSYIAKFLTENSIKPPKLEHPVFYASTWWALSEAAVKFLVAEMRENSYWENRFKYTYCPDEVVFPTIIGNSNFSEYCENNLHYIDWSTNPGPKTLATHDYEKIKASQKFFVRKIDPILSKELVYLMDDIN